MNRRAYLGCFEFLQDYFTPLGLRTCCSLRLKSSFHRLALSHFSCSYTHNTASMGPLRYVHILSLPQLGMCSPSPLQLPGILFLSPSIPAPPPRNPLPLRWAVRGRTVAGEGCARNFVNTASEAHPKAEKEEHSILSGLRAVEETRSIQIGLSSLTLRPGATLQRREWGGAGGGGGG